VRADLLLIILPKDSPWRRRWPPFSKSFAPFGERHGRAASSAADAATHDTRHTYDDTHLRDALGAADRPAPPVEGAYLARFTSALPAPAARAAP
jgi:hypothetical protein